MRIHTILKIEKAMLASHVYSLHRNTVKEKDQL
jgi:hypothetical protein